MQEGTGERPTFNELDHQAVMLGVTDAKVDEGMTLRCYEACLLQDRHCCIGEVEIDHCKAGWIDSLPDLLYCGKGCQDIGAQVHGRYCSPADHGRLSWLVHAMHSR